MILPPATLGVLGGGQLGRYFVLAARELGYRTLVLDPDPHGIAGAVADEHVVAAYDDAVATGAARVADVIGIATRTDVLAAYHGRWEQEQAEATAASSPPTSSTMAFRTTTPELGSVFQLTMRSTKTGRVSCLLQSPAVSFLPLTEWMSRSW